MIVLMLMPSSGFSALAEEPEADEESALMAEGPEGPSETVLNMIQEAEEKLLQSLEAEGEPATPEDEDGTDGMPESESTGELTSDLPTDQSGDDTENVTSGLQEALNNGETAEATENSSTEETPEGAELLLTPATALDESQPEETDQDAQKVLVVFRALFEAEEAETETEAATETAADTAAETAAETETEIPFRVSVYPVATEEIPEPEAIPAEEDGSFLLPPGDYVYTAEAEGYESIERTDLTVMLPENGEEQIVELRFEARKIMLFTASALKATAPTAAKGKYRIVIHPKRATLADFYSIRIVIEDTDGNTIATQEPALNQENKWSDIEAYFNLTAAPAIITISSMYAVAPSGGGGDWTTDPTAPHGGSYEYEQLSYTAAFREAANQPANAASVLFPQDGEINFCDYSILYLGENGQLPYRDEKGQIQYVEEGKWQNFIGSLDQSGWYAVREDYTSPGMLVSGKVNLVLCDGVTMNIAETGISVGKDCSLTIWGQEANSGTLIANGSKGSNAPSAGIEVMTGASLTINGGVITATGGAYCAGIGSNGLETSAGATSKRFPDSGTITINGGTVTTTGGRHGAGIGSGNCSNSGPITISGGTVTTTAGSGGAGIGGGQQGDSAAIVISGGTIVANGNEGGAGIGGGDGNAGHSTRSDYGNSGSIKISGGTITANGSNAAGIGGGYWQTNKGKIEITGGTVTANCKADDTEGGGGAGIGAGVGRPQEGDIIISGGTVMGVSNAGGAGIGGGSGINGNKGRSAGVIHISGKDTDVIGISCRGAGIGSGGTRVGQNFDAGGYNGGTITIDEGFVYGRSYQGGAGIGGGLGGDAGKITINGGYVMGIGGKRDYNWAKEDMKDDPFSGPGKHPINRWMDQDAFELISRAALSIAFSDTYFGAGIGSGSKGSDTEFGNYIHINGGYVEAKAGGAETCSIGWGYHASAATEVKVYTDAFVTYGHFEKKYETDKDYELVIDAETGQIKNAAEPTGYGFALIEPGHTVRYNMLGYGTAPQSTKIAYGNKLNEPAKPSAEGQTFLGWFLDGDCTQKVTFPLEIGEDTTLYAGWKQDSTALKERKVKLVWGEGESKPESVTVNLEQQTQSGDWSSFGVTVLNAGNGWTGSFTEPEAGKTYRIRETDGNGYEVLDGEEETGAAPEVFKLRNQAVFTVREGTVDREYQYKVTYEYSETENLTTITHSRSGIVYSAKVDWKLSEDSYAWNEKIPAVSAVLQHLETDSAGNESWRTVETMTLYKSGNWNGKFKAVPVDSDGKYRIREQVDNEKSASDYNSGFVFEENDDTVRNEILYETGDAEGDGKQPILRYKWVVRHADPGTAEYYETRMGLFRVSYSPEANGGFVITNQENYTVTTASSLVNGTIAVDKTMAAAGETVTVTVTPKDGCKLVALSYTPDGGTEQTVTEQNGKDSFTMPAANVFVSAIFSGTPYYYTQVQINNMISGTSSDQLPHPRTAWDEDRNSTLFLGWYQDAEYTEPISNASEVPETGAYARFIPENSLGLGVQFRTPAKSGNPDKTDLRLVAVIPDLKLYRQIGFKVEMLYKGSYVTLTDESYGTEIYSDYIWQTVGSSRSKFTVQNALGTGIGNETWSKNLTCYALMDMPNTYYVKDGQPVQTNFRVTQYLVTKDGSRSEVGAKKFYITYENGQPVAKPAS